MNIRLLDRRAGMLVRATLAQNIGTGCVFGGLGVSILALQEQYQASLAAASLALTLAVFSMTGCGPMIAGLIGRFGLRAVMTCGVALATVGYLVLAWAPSMSVVLAACALLIGPGTALFAALPPAVLASNWFPHDRGMVLGIAYLPVFITLSPMIGVSIIQSHGLTVFFLAMAGIHLVLLPLMLGVAEPAAEASGEPEAAGAPAVVATRLILATGLFWLIVLGDGILNGTAITGSAHMMAIFHGFGVSPETGAILLTLSGAASMVGSLVSGYACDRIGPATTLILAACGFAFAWSIIAITGWMPSMLVAQLLIGICGASVFPPISSLAVSIFGLEALPKVLGLLGIMTLPFTLVMPPAAGWLHDVAGTYASASAAIVCACGVAAAVFAYINLHRARNAVAREQSSAAA